MNVNEQNIQFAFRLKQGEGTTIFLFFVFITIVCGEHFSYQIDYKKYI
jgi:uncharacterized membrane protein YwzB